MDSFIGRHKDESGIDMLEGIRDEIVKVSRKELNFNIKTRYIRGQNMHIDNYLDRMGQLLETYKAIQNISRSRLGRITDSVVSSLSRTMSSLSAL